ncbi:MAG: SOS response-associated peptidase [Ignavibacteria bacterium]
MCSFFENTDNRFVLSRQLIKDIKIDLKTNRNINIEKTRFSPTDTIGIVKQNNKEFSLEPAQWGFKLSEKSPLIFNSRIETVIEKTFWSNLFMQNRCLMPATAFFEWYRFKHTRIPYRIYLKDTEVFFIAGITISFNSRLYASMITTLPNGFIKNIHNRMPAIIFKGQIQEFLTADYETAMTLCSPLYQEKFTELFRSEKLESLSRKS